MLRALWQHVQLHEGQEAKSSPAAHCIHCGHRYAANTTRILAHMTGYGGQVQKCTRLQLLSEDERAELVALVNCKKEKKAAREQNRNSGQDTPLSAAAAAAAAGDLAAAGSAVMSVTLGGAGNADGSAGATSPSPAAAADDAVDLAKTPMNGMHCAAGDLPVPLRAVADAVIVAAAPPPIYQRSTVERLVRSTAAVPFTPGAKLARKRPRDSLPPPTLQQDCSKSDLDFSLYLVQGHVSELDDAARRMAEAAWHAKENSYCPYSGCRVGAAVLSSDGRVFAGCSMENSSYGLSLCAERAAVAAAVAAGIRAFAGIAVASDAEGRSRQPLCGACWQTLIEFNKDWELFVIGPDRRFTRSSASAALPLARVSP